MAIIMSLVSSNTCISPCNWFSLLLIESNDIVDHFLIKIEYLLGRA